MLASLSLNKNELIALLPTKLNPATTALSLDGDVLTFITSMEADPKQLALELYDEGKNVKTVSALMESMGYKVSSREVAGWVSGRAQKLAHQAKKSQAVEPESSVISIPGPIGNAKTLSSEKRKLPSKDRPVSPMAASEWDRRQA